MKLKSVAAAASIMNVVILLALLGVGGYLILTVRNLMGSYCTEVSDDA